jgi:hypothetical protein
LPAGCSGRITGLGAVLPGANPKNLLLAVAGEASIAQTGNEPAQRGDHVGAVPDHRGVKLIGDAISALA